MVEEKARQAIAEALCDRAAELYGQERAQSLHPNMEQMAEHLWLISTMSPPRELEPEFFM